MQIIRRLEQLGLALGGLRGGGEKLAAVPTMGALHAGHMALVAEARARAERVVATIFVNPLQFGAGEDLDRYPRQEAADVEMLCHAGCDLLWLPAVSDIYPTDIATKIQVTGLSERWEGAARPGHFDGVATVVAKLILTIRPDLSLFGEKDFQQLAVVRRMVTDLGLGGEIVGVATVRDADGLALSSRNAYLSPDQRQQALALPSALNAARDAIRSGAAPAPTLAAAKKNMLDAGFSKIDYFALVNAATLEPLDAPSGTMRLIAAAAIGSTRLIDNIAV
ncbi:MAG: pantoate--beta-alanine ligase [Sphingomicrobium sp.]